MDETAGTQPSISARQALPLVRGMSALAEGLSRMGLDEDAVEEVLVDVLDALEEGLAEYAEGLDEEGEDEEEPEDQDAK